MWFESDIISTYTTDQAIEDGMVTDELIGKLARLEGFRFRTVMTTNLFLALEPTADQKADGDTLASRIHEMLKLAKVRMTQCDDTLIEFTFAVERLDGPEGLKVWAVLDQTPLVTFMLPKDY